MSSASGWFVEFHSIRDGRDYQSTHSETREQAIDQACRLMGQGNAVKQVIGPRGETVGLPEIERRYQELLATGRLV
jgi:hypothetical protein